MNPRELLSLIEAEEKRRLAETSLYEFVKQAWAVVEPGVPFIDGWHLQIICEHLEAITNGELRRLLINIPPRHAKSTIVSVMWPCWEWLTRPEEKYLCASYSGVLSTRDNVKARRLITSPWYQSLWADRFQLSGDQNQKTRFENDRTGYRIASSVGGTATGEGGSRLLLDDPHGAQDAQSDAMRDSSLEWFDMVWSTRLNNPKRDAMVTIMQRLHEQDVSGRILELGGWEHVCLPAEYDGKKRTTVIFPDGYDPRAKKDSLLWPERFGETELIRLKQQLGEYGTAGQLQQDPVPRGGGILKTENFRLWPKDTPLPQMEYVLQSYDCAFTEKTSGDPTAYSAYGVFTHKGTRNVMLLDAWDEHLGYPALRQKAVDEWHSEYGGNNKVSPPIRARKPDRVLVEAKASGQSLLQDLRLANVPAIGYNPGNADKISRAHQSAPTLELGLIWIPESRKNPGQFISWALSFVRQLAKFPVTDHDDYVDTFTQAIIYLKDEGWFELPAAEDDPIEEVDYAKRQKQNPYGA